VDDGTRALLERDVKALCDRGDQRGAVRAILQGYGHEIFGFLMAIHRDEAEADEVFSRLAENVWTGLPRFAWESSVRTWAYAIARHVSKTHLRTRARREHRLVGASDSFFQSVIDKVRTETITFLRTEKRTRLQALRDALSEEDRTLLILRVDRDLSWKELALIFAEKEGNAALDDAALARETARLRKRFQLVKAQLREMARREGLMK
jgi:RNA polymerase sigma-70 factor (ECF subfamily)